MSLEDSWDAISKLRFVCLKTNQGQFTNQIFTYLKCLAEVLDLIESKQSYISMLSTRSSAIEQWIGWRLQIFIWLSQCKAILKCLALNSVQLDKPKS